MFQFQFDYFYQHQHKMNQFMYVFHHLVEYSVHVLIMVVLLFVSAFQIIMVHHQTVDQNVLYPLIVQVIELV